MDVQQFEQAILKLAFETNTRVTPASVAYYLGIPSRESNRLLNELLREGALELDSDEDGNLFYRVPHSIEDAVSALEVDEPAAKQHPIFDAMVSINDEQDDIEALSPRRHRPGTDGGEDGIFVSGHAAPPAHAASPTSGAVTRYRPQDPEPYQGGYGTAGQAQTQEQISFDHQAVERRQLRPSSRDGQYRDVFVGVTTRPMEPDAWVGNCGASPVIVTPDSRCEPKPLSEARPTIVACIDADEEERLRTSLFEPAPVQQQRPAPMQWWTPQPQAQAGAMVLAGHPNLPATMDQLEQPEHQPGMALLLSLILCGTGQIYNGEVSKGIMMMVLCFLLWFVLLGWVVHIWSIVDAVVVAERINRRQQV